MYQGPPYSSGQSDTTVAGSTAGSIVRMGCTPILPLEDTSYDSIGIYVKTAATDAGAAAYLGYCPADSSTGQPDLASAVNLGSVSILSTGQKDVALSPNLELTAGLYYLLLAPYTSGTVSGTNPSFMGVTLSGVAGGVFLGSTTSFTYYVTVVRPSHGDTTTGTGFSYVGTSSPTVPRIGLKIASFP